MKNTLGKSILLFVFIFADLLRANTLADFQLTANKNSPYVKEAVEITFIAHQKDKIDVMFFFLTPKKSDKYKIVLLQKEAEELSYHEKKTKFSYLLFPLKDGDIDVDFEFIIKVASDAAVAQVYEGSRDNVKWIETDNTKVKLTPLTLHVKKLQHKVDLVGDFNITSKIDKTTIDAYESVNLKYYLKGTGFDEFSIEPLDKIDGVEIFKDIIKHYNKATKEGYEIQREFNYALVATKSFTVPSKEIHCYSPKKNKYYILQTKSYNIDVKSIPRSELIDKEDYPKSKDYSQAIKTFFIYLIVFLAGYLTAKIKLPLQNSSSTKYKDIQTAQDAKELLYILMHSYADKELENFYTQLEDIVYNKENANNFKKIKKEILKIVKSKAN